MRKLLLLLVVIQASSALYAQDDKDFPILIEAVVRKLQSRSLVYYCDRLPEKMYLKLTNRITRSDVNFYIERQGGVIQLTSSEIAQIKKELKAVNAMAWPDSLFADSKSIAFDSLVPKVEAVNRYLIDSIIKLPASTRPYSKILKWSFCFSRPVYLRNNELVIYYFQYYRSSSGSQRFQIHQRKNGVWQDPYIIPMGDW